MKEAINIIDMLVGLVYDLYPDEEYVELYGVEGKIAQAQKFIDSMSEDVFFEEPDTYDEYGVNTKNSFNTPPKEQV